MIKREATSCAIYKLVGKEAVPVETRGSPDWFKAVMVLEEGRNRVCRDTVDDVTENGSITIDVSTVFLALDHSFGRAGPPLLFETMVFGGKLDGEQERCATWDEAEKMHAKYLARVLATVSPNAKSRSMT